MAKLSQHLNKAIIYSLASLAETQVTEIIDNFKESMTQDQLHKIGVDRIKAILLSLCGLEMTPEWAKSTAVHLSHYLARQPIVDPSDGNYRTWGFTEISAAQDPDAYGDKPAYAVAVPGTSTIMIYVEMRERVLPSVSINTELTKAVSAFEKKEDRAAGPKDIAILKEQVVAKMLKTAPIRPKVIPIMFTKGLAIFFTSSAKAAEDASTLLRSVLGTFPAHPVTRESALARFFRDMISVCNIDLDNYDVSEAPEENRAALTFLPGTEGKLIDENDGATYTIKGENLGSRTGQAFNLLDGRIEMAVAEMGFTFYPSGALEEDDRALAWEIKLNSKGHIKKFGPADKSTGPVSIMEAQTQHYMENDVGLAAGWERSIATIWIIGRCIDDLLQAMIRTGAISAYDLGLAYTDDMDDERRAPARFAFLALIGSNYKAQFNATLEAHPELGRPASERPSAGSDEDDLQGGEEGPFYYQDEWGDLVVLQTAEERDEAEIAYGDDITWLTQAQYDELQNEEV